MSIFSDYTYDEYLAVWHQHFGDAETGEYGYWRGGTRVPHTITRLSPAQFQEHIARAVVADETFDRAMRADDQDRMRDALAASFPVELALLV